ncbi:adenylate kinase [Rhizophlyctis rosea]|nr:adenylate kinase [Rhizophlyctis rosea]
MQVSIIKTTLADMEAKGMKYDGWVLDGFPRTVDQVQALTANEIIPQYVVVLNNDINEESVRARHELFKTSWKTGRPITPAASNTDSTTTPPSTTPTTTTKQSTDMPDFEVQAYPYFDNLYNGFREEFNEVVKTLEEAEASVVTVQAELEVPTVLSMVMGGVDPFLPKAVPLTPKQIAELPPDIELGYTKDYCPYVLRESNVLQRGTQQFAVKYEGRYYYLSSEEARQAFVLEPHNYVSERVPMVPPPARVVVLGPPGSGKRTVISALSSYNVPAVRFDEYVKEFAERQEPGLREEIEYMIRENAGMLSPPVLFEVVQSLFDSEPYSTTGFLLSNFPRTKLEAETLLKHNFHVDAFIILNLAPEVAAHRLLPAARKKAEEDLLARAAESGDPAIVRRVQEAIRKGGGGKEEEEEGGEEDEEEGGEWRVRGDEELREEIVDTSEKETSLIGDIAATLDNLSIIPLINIDANKFSRVVIAAVKKKLKPYLDNRKSLFAPTKRLKRKQADRLLEYGVKMFSPFGRYDPVALHSNQSPSKKTIGSIPITYKDFIYFCMNTANAQNRLKVITSFPSLQQDLLQNALATTSTPLVPPPLPVPPQVIILGGPKTGKTTLARKVAEETGAVYLGIKEVVEMIGCEGGEVGVEEGGVGVGEKIKEILCRGGTIPTEHLTEAIRIVTSRAACQSRGWVLDGYPLTQQQTQHLEKAGIHPHIVVHLHIPQEEMERRVEQDRVADLLATPPTPHLNHPYIAQQRLTALAVNEKAIEDTYADGYANWRSVDGMGSKWAIKESVVRMVEGGVRSRRAYLDLRGRGHAAPIHDVGLSLEIVASHMGRFKTYCPVCLVDDGHLVQAPLGTELMAEYENHYYSCHSAPHLAVFLSTPQKYVATDGGKDLPARLPARVMKEAVKATFPASLEMRGYCPVTFVEGKGTFESIVPGDENFIAEYDGKMYCMASEEKLEKFMRTPDPYTNLRLPTKLPPPHNRIPVSSLPLIGYMEQTIADAVTKGLNAVGRARPKYPYRGVAESACQYLALWLKANNPASNPHTRTTQAKKLKQFTDRCDLISSLSSAFAKSGGTFVERDVMGEQFEKEVGEMLRLAPVKSLKSRAGSAARSRGTLLTGVRASRGSGGVGSRGSLNGLSVLPGLGSSGEGGGADGGKRLSGVGVGTGA